MSIFKEANNLLDDFIINHLDSYHKLRNYDFGLQNRSNVSQISKYTSHRILYEYNIVEKLKKFDKKKKFTDEILWRIYWKGYLENYKSIWSEYTNFKVNSNFLGTINYIIDGKTGIDCFDTWIEELRETNYLHNHSRMWFASLWIFELKLPWQLGARLFMRYLLDGDAASNTLSWRWVAGMHTNKKPYLATKENINKFTLNRFKKYPKETLEKINIIQDKQIISNKIPTKRNNLPSEILIMFENDLNIINRSNLFNSYSKVYIISRIINNNRFDLCTKVIQYKQILIQNVSNLIPNSVILNPNDLGLVIKNYKYIDVIYPGVGSNNDFINKFTYKKNIKVNFIYRDEDLLYWKYANSGFYKFKNSFYKLTNIKVM